MRSFVRCAGLVATGIVTIAAAGPLVQSAQASRPREPIVPSAIKVPAGNKVFLVGHAVGVQIYSCSSTPTGFGWTFVAPRADLVNDRGKLIVSHFGGPTWEARDGSKVVGKVAGDPVTVDRKAIPWLLLSAASTAAGPDGDELVATTYIQRIATKGGLAPSVAGCNKQTLGTQAESPYAADYFFYKKDDCSRAAGGDAPSSRSDATAHASVRDAASGVATGKRVHRPL